MVGNRIASPRREICSPMQGSMSPELYHYHSRKVPRSLQDLEAAGEGTLDGSGRGSM